jgi:hypothetical protein
MGKAAHPVDLPPVVQRLEEGETAIYERAGELIRTLDAAEGEAVGERVEYERKLADAYKRNEELEARLHSILDKPTTPESAEKDDQVRGE